MFSRVKSKNKKIKDNNIKKRSYKKYGGYTLRPEVKTFVDNTLLPAVGSLAIMEGYSRASGEKAEKQELKLIQQELIKIHGLKSTELNSFLSKVIPKPETLERTTQDLEYTTKKLNLQSNTITAGGILFLAYKIYKKYKKKKSPKKSPIVDNKKLSISQKISKLLKSNLFLSIVAVLIFYLKKYT